MAIWPGRNLGLDLVRATEAAAIAAGRWMGTNCPEEADRAATLAIRAALDTIDMDGRVVVGEEGSHALPDTARRGQTLGNGEGPTLDVVMDALDGRNLLANGYPGAIAVAAVAPRGTMWSPAAGVYMDKIVVGPEVGKALVPQCMSAPAAWTLALIARALDKRVSDLVVYVLSRPRHADLIAEIRAAGARVMLSPDGDVAGALLAASPGSHVDALMGAGGVLEGLIAACAVKAAGGAMLGRLSPQSSDEREAIEAVNLDARQVLDQDHLVSTNMVFFAATGITDGLLLHGVRYVRDRATSNSLILRGETRTRRRIEAEHLLSES